MEVDEPGWTPGMVEAWLAEAADTLQRLPDLRVPGYVASWRGITWDAGRIHRLGDKQAGLGPPSAHAIDRMDAVLLWLRWLDPRERRIVWQRACGVPWRMIARRLSVSRTTAWRYWVGALVVIVERLNERANKMPARHFFMQHFGLDLLT